MLNVLFALLSMVMGLVVAGILIAAIVHDHRRNRSPLQTLLERGVDWDAELAALTRAED